MMGGGGQEPARHPGRSCREHRSAEISASIMWKRVLEAEEVAQQRLKWTQVKERTSRSKLCRI